MRSSKTKEFKCFETHEWHALPIEAVEEAIESVSEGLSPSEVQIRQEAYGSNEFTEIEGRTWVDQLIAQVSSPLVIILLIAGTTTFVLGEIVDTFVIGFALSIAVVVGLIQEGKASRAFEKLSHSQINTTVVIREGKRHEIKASELVPGDVVLIQGGSQIPADIRLFEAKKLSVNESALTGEWLAVSKTTDRKDVGTPLAELTNMAWKGTLAVSGYGMGFVVATGDDTEVGKLAEQLGTVVEEITPLQWEMKRVSRIMLLIILGLVALIFLIGIGRGESLESMLLTSVAIAVASIPEGLPAAVTIILAVGMESLLKKGGLVRNLLAAETLGSTTYVLTDKTGTLTQAKMAVTDVIYVGCEDSTKTGQVCNWRDGDHTKFVFDLALCATDAFLDEKKDDEEAYVVRGEPIERAVLEAAQEVGVTEWGENMRGRRVDFLAFTSENRFAAGLTPFNDGFRLCINGAPEYLLSAATKYSTSKGEQPFTKKTRTFFRNQIKQQTEKGKRLIAVGYKDVSAGDISDDPEALLSDLVFVGILAVYDPVREGVSAAIEGVRSAGAEIRLVTGDNERTALAIAIEAGIATSVDVALTGKDIADLNDAELIDALSVTKVFARVLPRQKMRLVRVLQSRGHVVAMTGDGINDAPALQKANIGIAIGSGTGVAKEASDLVLVNDSFQTIYDAIEEGRRIISNLRKMIGYLLSTSLSEAVIICAALVIGAPLPLLPAQILWGNIIEEGLMGVAFAFEPGDKNAMNKKPQDIHSEGVLSKSMLSFTVLVIVVVGALLLALYTFLLMNNTSIEQTRSIMFLAVSIDSLFIAFSFRSLGVPVWKIPLRTNIFFIISFFISTGFLLAVLTVPFLQFVLSYEPVGFTSIVIVLLYGALTMFTIEMGKWFFFSAK